MTRRTMTSTSVEIPGPAGRLEARLDDTGHGTTAVAVICHPHPQQHGTMQNKVVTTLARAFANLSATAVRFNFRGVGVSGGAYAHGEGERDDALAVVAWTRSRWPRLPLYLGGFSFGAAVALAIAARVAPRGIVTVAPPVGRLPSNFEPPACPWLLVHGASDDVVPMGPVIAWATALAAPPRVVQFPGVGHFFHGRLNALSEAVTNFFAADFAARA
jgi:alpha/beta superfamily hydrolase